MLFCLIFPLVSCDGCQDYNPTSPTGINNDTGSSSDVNSGNKIQRNGRLVIHPNVASPDLLKMFSEEGRDKWKTVQQLIGGFQFHLDHVVTRCALCESNTFQNLSTVGAFQWIQNQGMTVSFEAGAVKEFECLPNEPRAINTTAMALEGISNLRSVGVRTAYVSMDEPLAGAFIWKDRCFPGLYQKKRKIADKSADDPEYVDVVNHWNIAIDKTASATADFIRAVNATGTAAGLVEPYPAFTADEIMQFIDVVRSKGVTMPFLRVDYDYYAIRDNHSDPNDLVKLEKFCHSRGMKFGIIVFGGDGTSNESYVADASTMMAGVAAYVPNADQILFESWAVAGNDPSAYTGRRLYPYNLPEKEPSLTYLVLEGRKYFRY
jgi:hypothetical protein